ncbi:unnamed protein product [Ambrosiozyma monospora]|uniref:Unnamed protein product n=1 Tax=Ambrosiozyma monospora TaxID=43982 RepID=A0ACB5T7Q8_AMBMO|nr:unnamed protein product [Ambrosiozyma monospora]
MIKLDDEAESGDCKLFEMQYILENPTNRIFQFSSSLGTSENFKIFNYKNQFNFLLMPYMKQVIRFKYQLISVADVVTDGSRQTERSVKLPDFKVYDLNYKVYLNNLVVCDSLKLGKNGIYYIEPLGN